MVDIIACEAAKQSLLAAGIAAQQQFAQIAAQIQTAQNAISAAIQQNQVQVAAVQAAPTTDTVAAVYQPFIAAMNVRFSAIQAANATYLVAITAAVSPSNS